jgi:hypothetical protein
LEDLFGQDELAGFSADMLNNDSNLYDEISFGKKLSNLVLLPQENVLLTSFSHSS